MVQTKENNKITKDELRQALDHVHARVQTLIHEESTDELLIVDDPTKKRIPFETHGSHDAFLVGGYVACRTCLATATCTGKAVALIAKCKGADGYKSASAHVHIARLRNGHLPRPERDAMWPDGVERSVQRRPVRVHGVF